MPLTRHATDRPGLLPCFEKLTNRLNFEELVVVSLQSSGAWWLFDTRTAHPPQWCPNPKCERAGRFSRYGTKEQYFDDCPLDGAPVRIRITRQRYKCLSCQKLFFEPIHGLDDTRHASRRLVVLIAKAALQRPFSHVAKECGVHEKTVRQIARSFFRALDAIAHFPTPQWLGIDEVYINGALCTVLTNLKDKKVYEILPDRKAKTIEVFLRGMPGRESVEVVCMDFCSLYRKQVRACLPGATIVVDKFHVMQLASNAIDQIRRRVKKKKSRKPGYDTRILRKRRHALSSPDCEALRRWEAEVPELVTAFALKEQFCKIWEAADEATARKLYAEWKDTCSQTFPQGFRRLIQTINRWEGDAFTGLTRRITNGYAEGMNRIIKDLNRAARGFTVEVLRAKVLYKYGYARIERERKKPRWTEDPIDVYAGEESAHGPSESPRAPRARANSTLQELAGSYVMGYEYDEFLREHPPSAVQYREDLERLIDAGIMEIRGDKQQYLAQFSSIHDQ